MPKQNRVQKRGEGLIYRKACTPRAASCRAARDDAVLAVQLPRGDPILPRQPPTRSSSIFARVPFFDLIFEGSFGGLLVFKIGHAAYRQKSLDVFFPTV